MSDPELLDPELLLLLPLDELPEDEPSLPLPELSDPDPELDPELPVVTATELPLSEVVLFPIPLPVLSFAFMLDKPENIGLSLLVIPYAVTAAAIHNTIIMEMIIFDLSNVIPPTYN